MGIEGGDYILPIDFYYATIHRPENTDKTSKMLEILSALEQLDYPCVYPVHPRNQKEIRMLMEKYSFKNIIAIRPVGYLMSIYLIKHARKIITDSGGLQREAFFAEKQCITVFDYIMWPETMVGKRNQMAKATTEDILDKVAQNQIIDKQYKPFGDGNSAEKIACIIEEG